MLPLSQSDRAARAADLVLGHPLASSFPKAATDMLAHVADGDHDLADADVSRLVLAALDEVVDAEIVAGREARL